MILVDTREQKNSHVEKAFDRMGIPYDRSKLYVGDYTLPNDQSVCVDRKGGLQEVYANTVQQHQRFRAECARAKQAGIRLIVLVEHSNRVLSIEDVIKWNNPRLKVSPLAVDGPRLCRIMHAMGNKYGFGWAFCDKAHTGKKIIELLGGQT